jgi:ketosteroid isomerase-like protein
MESKNIQTVRAYWAASERGDWEAAGRCIGSGYTWIDHTTEIVANTPEELMAARDEADAWSDETIEITRVMETTDGAVIAQATVTRTLTGVWRSVEPRGQRVRKDHCTIFRFDAEGRIVFEEQYEDALSVMRQLGAEPE